MKKYQLVKHPDMPSNLVLNIEDNAKEIISEVYLEDSETDWNLLDVTIFEESDDYIENLEEFEG